MYNSKLVLQLICNILRQSRSGKLEQTWTHFFVSLQSGKIVIYFLFHFEIKAKFETILPFKILSRLLLKLCIFEEFLISNGFILRVWKNIVWSQTAEEDHHFQRMCIASAPIKFISTIYSMSPNKFSQKFISSIYNMCPNQFSQKFISSIYRCAPIDSTLGCLLFRHSWLSATLEFSHKEWLLRLETLVTFHPSEKNTKRWGKQTKKLKF